MNYHEFHEDDLILRDQLALDRTRLANERTYLSYVRTAIMLGVSGVSLIRLFPNDGYAQIFGWTLLPIAAFLMLLATSRFLRLKRTLSPFLRHSS